VTGSKPAETNVEAVGPREVNEVIGAVRAFTDAMERVGVEEFGVAAGQLRKAELAWVLDRLDDVRSVLTSVLDQLSDVVEQYGADGNNWAEVLTDVTVAGDGLYVAMSELDPDNHRWDISGQQ
jgi:hypothetical protein